MAGRANYAVKKIDVSAAQNALEIVSAGVAMPDIAVLRVPAAAVVGDTPHIWLQLGKDADLIPLFTNAQPFHDTSDANQGLYLTCDAIGAGAILTLLIGFRS